MTTGDIFIYGGIGSEMGEVSFENVDAQIKANKGAKELTVHIISPGGDVLEGEAIYNALKNTGKRIVTHIEGTCASIATLIAAAGEKIIMNNTARFMIHNPQISGFNKSADSRELRKVATQLDQIKTLLINAWQGKTKLSNEKLWELYDNETWLTAKEAEQMGFIDESTDAIKAVAKVNLKFREEMKNKSKLQALVDRITNALKFTNEVTDTLEDGTAIVVMTDDGDWTGKQVLYAESGEALPPKEYPLTGGRVMVVGENSTIQELKEAEATADADMEKDKLIEQLKAQLAEATAKISETETAANAAKAEVVTAKAETVKFQNKLKVVESDFLKLKEEVVETIGDKTDVTLQRGAVKKVINRTEDEQPDFMGQDALKFLRNRNMIKQDED